MVQRNKPINLFQPSDKKMMLIKPSSPNYQDNSRTMMNRVPSDLNKNKMKKPRSTEIPEPGKPPNYMKSTSSFDAKKDTFKTLRKTTSFKSPRVSTKKNPSVLINRDTCSSTLKDSKFPAFLELTHGGTQLDGTSVFKVCHYTYCSLNGHHHHHNPPLPPLNRFISSKRQQILKTHGLSPPTANVVDLDIPSTDSESELLNTHQTSNPACLSPPPEKVDDLDFPNTDIESELSETLEMEMEDDLDFPNTDIECELSETLEMEMEEGLENELLETHQISNPDGLSPPLEKVDDQSEALEMEMEDGVEKSIDEGQLEEFNVEKCIDEGQLEEDQGIDLDHMKIAKSDRGAVEEMEEEQKGFNPKEPNYLDVESGPETEKVDLRHQELDDKKNSDEWMLDYAIQQAVNKLGSVRKKRVGLLVEAFEKVIPTHQYDHHRSSPVALNHSRQIIQACI